MEALTTADELKQDKAKLEADMSKLLDEFVKVHGDFSFTVEVCELIWSKMKVRINLKL